VRVDEGLRGEVAAAVRAVEANSGQQVVVTIVPRSAAHWEVALSAALAVSLSVEVLAALLYPDASALAVALDSVLGALLTALLVRGIHPLERLLLPRRVAARRVEKGAESAFCRQGVFRTHKRVGVLVYLSLLERRAVLLPDDGVVHALPEAAMASLRAQASALFGEPEPKQALLGLLDLMRRQGARYLPRSKDDVNELPDTPVIE